MTPERLAKAKKLAEGLVDSSLMPLVANVLKQRARQIVEYAAEIFEEEAQTARSVEVGETRCEDCHEPTGTLAVCKVCAGLRVESVLGSGEGVAIRFIEDCSRASGGMVNGNQLAQRATEALKAMRALGSGEAVPVAWRIGVDGEYEFVFTEAEARNHGGNSRIPLYAAPPHPTPSAWRRAIEEVTETGPCNFTSTDDRQNHDCLAAHAYQQAVEEVADEMDNRIAPLINTRAAEILAQWMRGE